MGLYEREYYHEEAAARGGGLVRGHSAVVVLIAINIIVFVCWQLAGEDSPFMKAHFEVSRPGLFEHFRFHTLITYAFSQFKLWHILFNMLFLFWFGRDLEEIYGPRDFVLFYLICGVISGLAHIAIDPKISALGASGSVMGVVIACACFYPDREIQLLLGFFLPLKLKLKILAIVFVAIDLFALSMTGGDGVARAAHLGGALAGYLYYKLDLRFFGFATPSGRTRVGIIQKVLMLFFPTGDMARLRFGARRQRLFGRKPKLKEVIRQLEPVDSRPSPPPPRRSSLDAETSKRVDELLQKISENGMGALTAEERDFLEASSKKYQR